MAVNSAYRTRSDLITEALGELGVLSTVEPPAVEDIAFVDGKLDATCRKLEGLEIVFVADRGQPGPIGGNIPAQWFSDLAVILADECKGKFGLPAADQAMLTQRGLGVPPGTGAAAMSLKKMQRGRATFEIQRTEYF